VDNNLYLSEERQALVREQISKHPTILVNKKALSLDE
jgi:hypothetical protein